MLRSAWGMAYLYSSSIFFSSRRRHARCSRDWSSDALPISRGAAVDPERAARRAGWRLMRETVRPYAAWVVLGVAVGITWTAARISVPTLTGHAIDGGIDHPYGGAL